MGDCYYHGSFDSSYGNCPECRQERIIAGLSTQSTQISPTNYSIKIQGSGTAKELLNSLQEAVDVIKLRVEDEGEKCLDGFYFEDSTVVVDSDINEDKNEN